jgi:hypothetical protein
MNRFWLGGIARRGASLLAGEEARGLRVGAAVMVELVRLNRVGGEQAAPVELAILIRVHVDAGTAGVLRRLNGQGKCAVGADRRDGEDDQGNGKKPERQDNS